jgi:hypothetical protein
MAIYGSDKEMATVVAKEILLGLIANGKNYLLSKGSDPQGGTDLAAHLGDCFETLLKKIKQAIKEY